MFLEYFKITGLAIAQIFFLGAIGFFLVKRNALSAEGLSALSRLVIRVIFPALIFSQLIRKFTFDLYPRWWVFPLISLAITVLSLGLAAVFSGVVKKPAFKEQFLSLITFQNSGYLPLAIVAAIFSGEQLSTMFIYIFLFLLGFDLIMWSLGIYMLTRKAGQQFKLSSIFSPPVIANLSSLLIIALGLNRFIPHAALAPVEMIGNCTLPLAMFIVGGNIASIRLENLRKAEVFWVVLNKLVILPAAGLFLVISLKLPELLGFLVIMQLAMPSATSLSVILSHYKKEDTLVSQGVFYTHIVSMLTIPLFLSLYLALRVIK